MKNSKVSFFLALISLPIANAMAIEYPCAGECDTNVFNRQGKVIDRSQGPEGWMFWGDRIGDKVGIFRSPLREYKPEFLYKNSDWTRGSGMQTYVTPDGKWVVLKGASWIRTDGSGSKWVPRLEGYGLWYNAPGSSSGLATFSLERCKGDGFLLGCDISATNVKFVDGGPTADGPTRKVTQGFKFGGNAAAKIGLAKNRIFGRVSAETEGEPSGGSRFITIPDNGLGVATPANIWFPSNRPTAGCGETLSQDGTLAAQNATVFYMYPSEKQCGKGYPSNASLYQSCVPSGHAGPAIIKFLDQSAPKVPWESVYIHNAYKGLWAPKSMWDPSKTWGDIANFVDYQFTNSNDYLTAREVSGKNEDKNTYLIDAKTNQWIRLFPEKNKNKNVSVFIKGVPPTTSQNLKRLMKKQNDAQDLIDQASTSTLESPRYFKEGQSRNTKGRIVPLN